MRSSERLIPVKELDDLAKGCFPVSHSNKTCPVLETLKAEEIEQGYATLNRLQSVVFPIAYQTNENLLICAPTGAVSFFPV